MFHWKDLDRHHINGTDESTLGKDLLTHLMYHDLSDLGWSILILIVPMTIEHTIFGVLHSVLKREHVEKTRSTISLSSPVCVSRSVHVSVH